MATSAATLIQRARRFVGDYNDYDQLTAAVSSTTATTITVADATIYTPGIVIQIDSENMRAVSGTGTTLTVRRGIQGSTAATHTDGATILNRPAFTDIEYLDALNSAKNAAFPLIYQPVIDETTTISANTYEYTIPNMASPAQPIPAVWRLSINLSGDVSTRWFHYRDWDVLRGATPKIRFNYPLMAGTLRIEGYGPFADLALADSLPSLWPVQAEDYLVLYTAAYLTASGESRAIRQDTGARDKRESAVRTGSSMNASNALLQRAQIRLAAAAMAPIPRHCRFVVG
jgi:hypothetical protein